MLIFFSVHGCHLRFPVKIKNENLVNDHPMITHVQFGISQSCNFLDRIIMGSSHTTLLFLCGSETWYGHHHRINFNIRPYWGKYFKIILNGWTVWKQIWLEVLWTVPYKVSEFMSTTVQRWPWLQSIVELKTIWEIEQKHYLKNYKIDWSQTVHEFLSPIGSYVKVYPVVVTISCFWTTQK
jgi:hypothetical protein